MSGDPARFGRRRLVASRRRRGIAAFVLGGVILLLSACGGGAGGGDRVQSVVLSCRSFVGGAMKEINGPDCDVIDNPFPNAGMASPQVLARTYQDLRYIVTVRRPDGSTYQTILPAPPRAVLSQPLTPPAQPGDPWPK